MDHWEEKALPSFVTSTVEAVRSVKRLRQIARQDKLGRARRHELKNQAEAEPKKPRIRRKRPSAANSA
jgi:hypothetical protein